MEPVNICTFQSGYLVFLYTHFPSGVQWLGSSGRLQRLRPEGAGRPNERRGSKRRRRGSAAPWVKQTSQHVTAEHWHNTPTPTPGMVQERLRGGRLCPPGPRFVFCRDHFTYEGQQSFCFRLPRKKISVIQMLTLSILICIFTPS